MQTISFNDRNAATGLGSATIYLFLYFAQITLVVIMKIVVFFTGNEFIKEHHIEKVIKGLFFNTLISLILEGLIEFIVYSALNIFTKDFTLSGEILGFLISIISLFCAFIIIPIASLWAIFTKNEK